MSKIEMLRLLITQRLTAAAEEIFGVFGRTIAEYEEEISRSKLEIDRQRRLLELRRTPRISVQGDGSAVPEQQDRSVLDLDEGASPHIKEEEEEDDWSERDETPQTSEQNNLGFMSFGSGGSSRLRGRRDRGGPTSLFPKFPDRALEDLKPDPQPELPVLQTRSEDEGSDPCLGNGQLNHGEPDAPPPQTVDSYICTICGRAFAQRSHWAKHVQVHRKVDAKTDKSYTCDICGKRLTRFDGYQKHLRIHTGEKPYCCGECGRRFSDNSNYKRHTRTHAGQKMVPS